jgi:adenylate cyclase
MRQDVGVDFEAAGLLDGLDPEHREARLRLLEKLSEDGFELEELQRAAKEDRLALLPVDRVLGGFYTAAEIEERTGLPAGVLLRLRRMLGLPEASRDDRWFGDEDVAMANSTRLFIEAGLSEKAIAEMTRVLGESMSRLAATTSTTFVETFLRPGDTEFDVAERFAALAEALTPAMQPVLTAAYTAHLRESVRRAVLSRADLEAGAVQDAQEVAICFADLVGFTRMGVQVEPQELGGVAGKLAELANELAEPPVRLIKTIGDAAMFVSPEPGPMVSVALSLVRAMREDEMPSVRAGISFGPALLRAGDYYGHCVNVASRVTGVARPDSVLCTQDVRDAVDEGFDWSFAGRHRLKGVKEPLALHRARPRRDGA